MDRINARLTRTTKPALIFPACSAAHKYLRPASLRTNSAYLEDF